ncbi:Tripartite DNA replication factor [Gurleya vavrai]
MQFDAINEEEEFEKNEEKVKTTFMDQIENKIYVKMDKKYIEKSNFLKEFISVYNINGLQLSLARLESIENDTICFIIRDEIQMNCYYNIFIGNTRGDIFFKTLRYILFNIPINGNLIEKIIFKKKNTLIKNSLNTYVKNFRSTQSQEKNTFEINIPSVFKEEFMKLNDEQRSALYLSLNCKEYRLIHGFPGTGKSTVIVLLIKILVFLGKKVLLICYTNLAIDNILKKLSVRYHRALKETKNFESVKEIKDYYNSVDLVAGTCYSFKDDIFINRKFDFTIIDEASQQHLLLSLLPISRSEKFILVGDHLQLNPIFRKSNILGNSLFEELYEDASELKKQYRMGDEIMKISNKMFYNNKMIGNNNKGSVEFIDSRKNNIEELMKNYEKNNFNIQNSESNDQQTYNFVILCYFNISVSKIKKIINCKVETVDRFQGSEADEIFLYLDPVVENDIMYSRERLNVALTRARKKLIIFGDKEKLCKIDLFDEMFSILDNIQLK